MSESKEGEELSMFKIGLKMEEAKSILSYEMKEIEKIENSKKMVRFNRCVNQSDTFRQEIKTCSELRLEEIF